MYPLAIQRKNLTTRGLTIFLQADMHVNIAKDFSHITSMSQKASWSRETAKEYPKHVSLFRGASLYARLAEPAALHNFLSSSPAPQYHLETSTNAFKVTPCGGIIYVSNVTALYDIPDTLKWVFTILYIRKWVPSYPFTLIEWLIS